MKSFTKRFICSFICIIMVLCSVSVIPAQAITYSGMSVKSSVQSNYSIALKWKKIKGISTYYIYRSDMTRDYEYGKPKMIATVYSGKTSYTDKKVKKNKYYHYTVKAYKKSGKKIKCAYEGYTDNYTGIALSWWGEDFPFDAEVSPKSIPIEAYSDMGISPDGFEIQRANADENGKRTGKWKTIKTIKRKDYFKYNDETVSTGKTYLYRARCYKKVKGKLLYGPYNDPVTMSAVNIIGKYTIQTSLKANEKTNSFVVELTGDENNGSAVIPLSYIYEADYMATRNDGGFEWIDLKISAYSYDNIDWKSDKKKLSLKPGETIYLKFETVKKDEYITFSEDYEDCYINSLMGKYKGYSSIMNFDLLENTAEFKIDGEAYH